MTSSNKRSFVAGLATAHGRKLHCFLSSRLRNSAADVPDLVQEIYLRLLRIQDHEAIRNPQAYLYTIATHVLRQYHLQHSARSESMDPLEIVSEFQSAAPDPADEVEAGQLLDELGRELERLSPRAYATLVMYRCEGMTLHEIGERLGVSHVMARKYLTRAIAYCDRRLEEKV